MKPDERNIYVYATKDGITVIRFARDVEAATKHTREITEWAGKLANVRMAA